MSRELVCESGPSPAPVLLLPAAAVDAEQLVTMFLSGRSPRTIEAYRADLETFRTFVGAVTASDAARLLLTPTAASANAQVLKYRNAMVDHGYAPATINRRLAALRALVTLGRILGIVAWELEVANVRTRAYRDTRGPGDSGVRRLLAIAQAQPDRRKAARDVTLLRLLHDIALRRGEVCSLDLADYEPAMRLGLDAPGQAPTRRVMVCGKGRAEREPIGLPRPTAAAIEVWLSYRGGAPGPLLPSLDITGKGPANGRLTGAGVWAIVRELGRKAGLPAWPHGLRHTGITRALDVTGGNVRAAQRFSRHRDVRTLMVYDDNRQDIGAEVAELVAAVMEA